MDYLINIAYDGHEYRGYSTQPHKNTVQDDLEQALEKIFKEKIKTTGASRTDSKVHALDQYVIFKTSFIIDPVRLKRAINMNTKKGLYVKECRENKELLHPRYDCIKKTYQYKIITEYDPFQVNYAFFQKTPIDINKMIEASKYFIGKQDFSSFCAANTHITDKVRTIYDVKINEDNKNITFEITGDGFLYNMVRIIVGTLLDVAMGKIEINKMPEIIKSKDRTKSGVTAPPQGLYLKKIIYKNE